MKTVGVTVPAQEYDLRQVARWEAAVGFRADSVTYYADPATPLHGPQVKALADTGRRTVLTLEPRVLTLEQIADGTADRTIAQLARWSAPYPTTIRFAHEMNGSWYPWAGKPGTYLSAWKRARSIFRAQGNLNPWCWSPNISSPQTTPLADYYPGNDQAEYVALDGYSYPKARSLSFADTFGPDLTTLAALTPLPIVIGETGVDQDVPDRAGWVRDMFATLIVTPRVVGLTWFEHDRYAIATDHQTAAAFHAGASAWTAR